MAVRSQSAAVVARSLSGIDFPAGRDQLVEHARKNQAGEEMLEFLRHMPETRYNSMADVFKGVSKAGEKAK